MNELLRSQGAGLVLGANSFSLLVQRLQGDFENEIFHDWPTVILTQTIQVTVVSLFKLLPPANEIAEIVDSRSIATLIRNVIDTYDVMKMMIASNSPDEHQLNRNILGYYVSGRFAHIQSRIDRQSIQKFYPLAKEKYWEKILESPLYDKVRMAKLKSGESVFYRSRTERISDVCGKDTEFVSGILADLSAHVHSIPPTLWLGSSSNAYIDDDQTRNVLALWIRIANFYYAQAIELVVKATGYERSENLEKFTNHHKSVFSDPVQ